MLGLILSCVSYILILEISQIYTSSHESQSFETRFCSESQNPSVEASKLKFDGSKLELASEQFSSGSIVCDCVVNSRAGEVRTLTFRLKTHNEDTEREDENCGHRIEIATHGDEYEFNCTENEIRVDSVALANLTIALIVKGPVNISLEYELSVQAEEEFHANISCWPPTPYVDRTTPSSTEPMIATNPLTGTLSSTNDASSTEDIRSSTSKVISSSNTSAALVAEPNVEEESTAEHLPSAFASTPSDTDTATLTSVPQIPTSTLSVIIGSGLAAGLCLGILLLVVVICYLRTRNKKKKTTKKKRTKASHNPSSNNFHNNLVQPTNHEPNDLHDNYHDNYVEPNNFHNDYFEPSSDSHQYDTGEYSTISKFYSYPSDFSWVRSSENAPNRVYGSTNDETCLKQVVDPPLSKGYSLAKTPKQIRFADRTDTGSVNSYLKPLSKADMLTTVDHKNGYKQFSTD